MKARKVGQVWSFEEALSGYALPAWIVLRADSEITKVNQRYNAPLVMARYDDGMFRWNGTTSNPPTPQR